jgi:hypothetical protein
MFSFLSESEESDYDDQCLGGTGKYDAYCASFEFSAEV